MPSKCVTSSRAPAIAAAEAEGSPASCSDCSASTAGTPPGLADVPGGQAVSVQPNPLFDLTPSPDAGAAKSIASAYAQAVTPLAPHLEQTLSHAPVPGGSGHAAARMAAGSARVVDLGTSHAGFDGTPGSQGGAGAGALSPEVLGHAERQVLAGARGPSAVSSSAADSAPGASTEPGSAAAPVAGPAGAPNSGPHSDRGAAAGAGRSGAGPHSSPSVEREPLAAREGTSASGVRVSASADEQAAIALGLGLNPSPSPTLEAVPAPAPRTPRSAVRRRNGGPAEGEGSAIGRPLRVATPLRSVTAPLENGCSRCHRGLSLIPAHPYAGRTALFTSMLRPRCCNPHCRKEMTHAMHLHVLGYKDLITQLAPPHMSYLL